MAKLSFREILHEVHDTSPLTANTPNLEVNFLFGDIQYQNKEGSREKGYLTFDTIILT